MVKKAGRYLGAIAKSKYVNVRYNTYCESHLELNGGYNMR